ncbi:hypothetical protein GQR58_022559 [Nymphon striatum]|nr:hypothetical protein GQR58_022559 [Nymphon striatum]
MTYYLPPPTPFIRLLTTLLSTNRGFFYSQRSSSLGIDTSRITNDVGILEKALLPFKISAKSSESSVGTRWIVPVQVKLRLYSYNVLEASDSNNFLDINNYHLFGAGVHSHVYFAFLAVSVVNASPFSNVGLNHPSHVKHLQSILNLHKGGFTDPPNPDFPPEFINHPGTFNPSSNIKWTARVNNYTEIIHKNPVSIRAPNGFREISITSEPLYRTKCVFFSTFTSTKDIDLAIAFASGNHETFSSIAGNKHQPNLLNETIMERIGQIFSKIMMRKMSSTMTSEPGAFDEFKSLGGIFLSFSFLVVEVSERGGLITTLTMERN